LYDRLFADPDKKADVQIGIQERTSQICDFDHVYAVSLSEHECCALVDTFWQQSHNEKYDPICDLFIAINNILIVIEAKRDNVDCTAQLYNQILNIYEHQSRSMIESKDEITPVDLNWQKLMRIAVEVVNFERATSNQNRFLSDFIQLVRNHNFEWLPEHPIGSLDSTNADAIYRRIESGLIQFCKGHPAVRMLSYSDRLGCSFTRPWAQELLFEYYPDSNEMVVRIYPANTKSQGYHIFYQTPQFADKLCIADIDYALRKRYHIKFSGQSFITGIWFEKQNNALYTKENFEKYTGRKKREDWTSIENLLDQHLANDWKTDCDWENKIVGSNRTQFDISFGYEFHIGVDFKTLMRIDRKAKDIEPLSCFLGNIYAAFENDLLKDSA
jgi:hypothetical protein